MDPLRHQGGGLVVAATGDGGRELAELVAGGDQGGDRKCLVTGGSRRQLDGSREDRKGERVIYARDGVDLLPGVVELVGGHGDAGPLAVLDVVGGSDVLRGLLECDDHRAGTDHQEQPDHESRDDPRCAGGLCLQPARGQRGRRPGGDARQQIGKQADEDRDDHHDADPDQPEPGEHDGNLGAAHHEVVVGAPGQQAQGDADGQGRRAPRRRPPCIRFAGPFEGVPHVELLR